MTNQEKILLEEELWQLEVVIDNPEFLTRNELKREIKRLKEIKKLLKGNYESGNRKCANTNQGGGTIRR